MSDDRPRVQRAGAYAWCERDGRVLLSRYVPPDARWVLPGGGIEHGEDPEDAVLRELGEETGLTGRVVGLIGVRSSVWPLPDRVVHNLALVYRVEVTGGTLRAETGGSSDAADWFDRETLDALPRTALVDWTLDRVG